MIKRIWQYQHTPLILAICLVVLMYWILINTKLTDIIVGGI